MCCERRKNDEASDMTRVANTRWNPLIFLPPALCDMTATSIMYVGLNLTYASSFQMLRGMFFVLKVCIKNISPFLEKFKLLFMPCLYIVFICYKN